MTIIKPNAVKKNLHSVGFLIVIAALAGLALTFSYINLGAMRDNVKKIKKEINATIEENSDLENRVYALTDLKKLSELAAASGLVIEKNPKYFILK